MAKRFRFMKDDDGHTYLIEVGKEKAFLVWLDAAPYWKNYEGEEFEGIGGDPSSYTFTDPRADQLSDSTFSFTEAL